MGKWGENSTGDTEYKGPDRREPAWGTARGPPQRLRVLVSPCLKGPCSNSAEKRSQEVKGGGRRAGRGQEAGSVAWDCPALSWEGEVW